MYITLKPTAFILDLKMPGMSGLDTQPNIDEQIDYILFNLNIKKYTKGSKYLKTAINIAQFEKDSDIDISTITKKIAFRNNISNSESIQSSMDKSMKKVSISNTEDIELKKIFDTKNYKITTKDFIVRALSYIDKKSEK